MTSHRWDSVRVFGFVTLLLGLVTQPLSAANNCKAVDADQEVTLTSPVTATGTITRGGILNGTTADAIDPLSVRPTNVPTTISFTDTLTITTDQGTLTTSHQSIFDTAGGVFSSNATIAGGTGIFAGATGPLFISGSTTNGTDCQDRIIGEICLAP